MQELRVSLFGTVRFEKPGQLINVSGSARLLLAFLLLHRNRIFSREVIAGQLWDGQSQESARKCLNTAIWRLRRVIETGDRKDDPYLITTSGNEIGFNTKSRYWLDVEVLEQALRMNNMSLQNPQATDAVVENLEEILALYQGDLMEGFYADWVIRERERLRLMYLKGLIFLLNYFEHSSQWEKGLTCGQKILDLDPLREDIHRKMMRFYLENGQRAQAIQQYRTCFLVLKTELGIQPMPETQMVYQQVLELNGIPDTGTQIGAFSSRKQTLQSLRQALQACENAEEQIRATIQLIEPGVDLP